MDSRKLAAIVAPVMLTAGLLGASAVAAPNSGTAGAHSHRVGMAEVAADPSYSRAPTPDAASASPVATPSVTHPAVEQENPCPPGTAEESQSPTCKMKGKVDTRLKDCPPDPAASPAQQAQSDTATESGGRPSGSGTSGDRRAADDPHISTCMDQVAGIQGAHNHQQAFQKGLESKITGFQEAQKDRDTSFSEAANGLCTIPLPLLATVPPDVTRFDPKDRFC
ncbi:hypothetical protein JQK87_00935 [Streptomyces sp. G44]|uniref:hypothetical protein n=1 Tax=Streptomyces sp. G44 TaxID=2807632 RepID=UPI0019617387|nr:hypothetical protein [Streptomyces sp. G44]MBM7167011.1 hypothetical protein [Streptomyces sp. G44]